MWTSQGTEGIKLGGKSEELLASMLLGGGLPAKHAAHIWTVADIHLK